MAQQTEGKPIVIYVGFIFHAKLESHWIKFGYTHESQTDHLNFLKHSIHDKFTESIQTILATKKKAHSLTHTVTELQP